MLNVDTGESTFTPLTNEAFQASVDRLARVAQPEAAESADPRESAPPQEAAQSLWRYLLIGLALVLVGEGLLAARTP